ncbi:MAG: hypothetical protein IJ572_01650 [Bacilli bacterium]|nr:hypothetical protein [Bacilli bacterium]
MKITIENLIFPCELKNNIKLKSNLSKLDVKYIAGHIIKINNTNLSLNEPHKIIINSNITSLIAYIYDDSSKIYLPTVNAFVSLNKFINIVNSLFNN